MKCWDEYTVAVKKEVNLSFVTTAKKLKFPDLQYGVLSLESTIDDLCMEGVMMFLSPYPDLLLVLLQEAAVGLQTFSLPSTLSHLCQSHTL